MADVHTREIRSKNMAAIKGKNTKPEMLVCQFLNRYQRNIIVAASGDNKQEPAG